MNFIKSYFQLDKYKTNIKTEFIAGLTTFISMSYILFVNPSVLGASGMNTGAVFTATALAAALGTAIMGIVANYPIGEAPALGINAFFAYTVCVGMHVSWQTALASVFVASIIFILITLFKLREKIIDSIPADLKFAISSGIGLFIAFLGLQNGKLIVANKSTLVGLGSLHDPLVWITIFGFGNCYLNDFRSSRSHLYWNGFSCDFWCVHWSNHPSPQSDFNRAKFGSNLWSSYLPC